MCEIRKEINFPGGFSGLIVLLSGIENDTCDTVSVSELQAVLKRVEHRLGDCALSKPFSA